MIIIQNLTKKFRIPHEKRNSVFQTIRGIFNPLTYETINALDNITFEVKKGEFIGIIGKNGSGKSTLLKILAGVLKPNSGNIKIDGIIIPFLELGLGFNGELSGKENIFLNGILMGLSNKNITEKFPEIVNFSELNNFIDAKLKNYSTGMQMRLAFSIAIHAKGDIYLIDEVLAVGDAEFQKKCFSIIEDFKKQGKTIIFVSHDLISVEKYCDKVIWLENGKIKDIGKPDEIIREYLKN